MAFMATMNGWPDRSDLFAYIDDIFAVHPGGRTCPSRTSAHDLNWHLDGMMHLLLSQHWTDWRHYTSILTSYIISSGSDLITVDHIIDRYHWMDLFYRIDLFQWYMAMFHIRCCFCIFLQAGRRRTWRACWYMAGTWRAWSRSFGFDRAIFLSFRRLDLCQPSWHDWRTGDVHVGTVESDVQRRLPVLPNNIVGKFCMLVLTDRRMTWRELELVTMSMMDHMWCLWSIDKWRTFPLSLSSGSITSIF